MFYKLPSHKHRLLKYISIASIQEVLVVRGNSDRITPSFTVELHTADSCMTLCEPLKNLKDAETELEKIMQEISPTYII